MSIEIKKKEGESSSALFFNFSKKVKRSGILREARKRSFRTRKISRVKRHASALHREIKKTELERLKKLGLV